MERIKLLDARDWKEVWLDSWNFKPTIKYGWQRWMSSEDKRDFPRILRTISEDTLPSYVCIYFLESFEPELVTNSVWTGKKSYLLNLSKQRDCSLSGTFTFLSRIRRSRGCWNWGFRYITTSAAQRLALIWRMINNFKI